MHTIEVACLHCDKTFTTDYKFRNRRKFCSIACGVKFRHPPALLICAQCGKTFPRAPSDIKKAKSNLSFCSRACKSKAQCIGGIKEIQPAHDGKGTSYYRASAIRHYGALCIRCGYSKDVRMLDVDHIDNNRNNHQLDNLQVLCIWCHTIKTRGVEAHKWDGNLAQ